MRTDTANRSGLRDTDDPARPHIPQASSMGQLGRPHAPERMNRLLSLSLGRTYSTDGTSVRRTYSLPCVGLGPTAQARRFKSSSTHPLQPHHDTHLFLVCSAAVAPTIEREYLRVGLPARRVCEAFSHTLQAPSLTFGAILGAFRPPFDLRWGRNNHIRDHRQRLVPPSHVRRRVHIRP